MSERLPKNLQTYLKRYCRRGLPFTLTMSITQNLMDTMVATLEAKHDACSLGCPNEQSHQLHALLAGLALDGDAYIRLRRRCSDGNSRHTPYIRAWSKTIRNLNRLDRRL